MLMVNQWGLDVNCDGLFDGARLSDGELFSIVDKSLRAG